MDTGDYTNDVPPLLRAAMDRLKDPHGTYRAFRAHGVNEEMVRRANAGIPPVTAAEAELLGLGPWVKGHDAKRVFGRLTKFIMTDELGYVQGRSSVRTPDSKLFTKGTVFSMPSEESSVTPDFDVEALSLELLSLSAKLYAAATSGETTTRDAEAIQNALAALR